jgi:DNA polymerase
MQIKELHRAFDDLHKKHGAKHLCSIYGAGCTKHPRVMFVFMNPTGRNISTNKEWRGIRAPWLGTKTVWKLFFQIGIISPETYKKIERMSVKEWTPKFCSILYREVKNNKVFITNLGKCTQIDARKLNDSIFKDYLELMRREIFKVNPKIIITFGNQVSSILLGKQIQVSNYKNKEKEELFLNGKIFPVFPVFYPVGQGMRNMSKAIERIRKIIL